MFYLIYTYLASLRTKIFNGGNIVQAKESSASRIALLMMQKNEGDMLDLWLRYHSHLVGPTNLYVFDNGSEDESTLKFLATAAAEGVHVYYKYKTQRDFESKGQIIVDAIQSMERDGAYEFFFPMDCDEMLAVERDDGSFGFALDDINQYLSPHIGTDRVLQIRVGYHANPVKRDHYTTAPPHQKCFFYRNTADSLDTGYHHGRTKRGPDFDKTRVVYFHAHYHSFAEVTRRSKAKLAARVKSFSVDDLISYYATPGAAGIHMIPDLLKSDEDYYAAHAKVEGLRSIPALRKHLNKLGLLEKFDGLMEFDFVPHQSQSDRLLPDVVGFIDRVSSEGTHYRFQGWVVLSDGTWPAAFQLASGDNIAFVGAASRIRRNDVLARIPDADSFCGFDFLVSSSHLSMADKIEVRPVHISAKTLAPLDVLDSLRVRFEIIRHDFLMLRAVG